MFMPIKVTSIGFVMVNLGLGWLLFMFLCCVPGSFCKLHYLLNGSSVLLIGVIGAPSNENIVVEFIYIDSLDSSRNLVESPSRGENFVPRPLKLI